MDHDWFKYFTEINYQEFNRIKQILVLNWIHDFSVKIFQKVLKNAHKNA